MVGVPLPGGARQRSLNVCRLGVLAKRQEYQPKARDPESENIIIAGHFTVAGDRDDPKIVFKLHQGGQAGFYFCYFLKCGAQPCFDNSKTKGCQPSNRYS